MSHSPQPPDTLGVILAGGLSRRMQGAEKAFLDLGGARLVERVARRLAPQVTALVINANGDPARFAPLLLPVIADDVPGHPGPLAGVLRGLDQARQEGMAWVLTAPCDSPVLPGDLVERLHRRRVETGASGAVAASGGRLHPAVALWPAAAREHLAEALLGRGERRVRAVIDALGFCRADWPAEPFDPFANVNEPSDADAARIILQTWPEA